MRRLMLQVVIMVAAVLAGHALGALYGALVGVCIGTLIVTQTEDVIRVARRSARLGGSVWPISRRALRAFFGHRFVRRLAWTFAIALFGSMGTAIGHNVGGEIGTVIGAALAVTLAQTMLPGVSTLNRLLLAIATLLLFTEPALCDAAPPQRPNVIVILADDLGWTDIACYGSDLHETPHLDRLAKDGMRFTQNYSACTVCSPTRAALLTGKYPARLHITDWIPGLMPDNPKLLVPDWTKHLPTNETTIATLFQSSGYITASIGKWHLGGEAYYPDKHGFDVNIAGTDKAATPSYIAPWKIPTLTEGKDGDYLTDRLAEEAVKFVEQKKDRPFFFYLPHFAVHTPIQGRGTLVAKYQAKRKAGLTHTNAAYAAMIESLDASVGRIRAKLEELKLADRTIIIFTSDNGGRVPTTSNKPLRFGKASAYEGGVRVPLIVHWPGVTKPGRVSDVPVITMDLLPTLVDMAGLKLPQSKLERAAAGSDGISLAPLLRGTGGLTRTELFWHYPHHQHYQLGGAMPYGAIRSGDFKLIEFFNDMRVELYDIKGDIGEQHDLAKARPKLTEELRARLHAWRREVGAQMPTPNPNYNPTKAEYNPPAKKAKKKM